MTLDFFFSSSKGNRGDQLLSTAAAVAERLCIKQAVLGSIPSGDQIFFNSVLLKKKACDLMSYSKFVVVFFFFINSVWTG